MLKKANKNQIIKKINLEESFRDENNFYIPVLLKKSESLFFDVTKLTVTIIPKNFVFKNINNTNISEEERSINSGYRVSEKPLFIDDTSKNLDMFSTKDVQSGSSNQSIFKKIYSKNIVSSYGQEEFLDYSIPVFFSDEDFEEKTFTLRIPVNLIQDKTTSITRTSGDVETENIDYKEFIVKAYAINSNNEVIDNLNIESKPINSYDLINDSSSRKYVDTQNSLSYFLNSFELIFSPYNFPISESFINRNLGGFDVAYNKTMLRNIFSDERFQLLPIQNAKTLNIIIEKEDLDISYSLATITQRNIGDFDDSIDRQGYSFSNNVINDPKFFNFIESILDYLDLNKVQSTSLDMFLNLSYDQININVEKSITVDKNHILQLYNDYLKYNFEKDLKQRQVILAEVSKYKNIGSIRQSNIYRLTLSIRTDKYLKQDILQNNINLTFIKSDFSIINSIQKFYLDDSLSEDNFILINSQNELKNYFIENNFIDLYFSYTSNEVITSCYINFFGKDANLSFRIGPFSTRQLDFTTEEANTQLINLYDICSNLLGRNTSFLSSFSSEENIRSILKGEFNNNYFQIDFTNLIENSSFKSLGYFDNNLSIQEKITSLANDVIVIFKKSLYVDNYKAGEIKTFYVLSDIIDRFESLNGSNRIRIKESSTGNIVQSLDLETTMKDNLLGIEIINSIKEQTIMPVDKANIFYSNQLSFIVMKKNTISSFGENLQDQQLKQNFIDFVISNNENYSVTSLEAAARNIFSENFNEDKKSYFKKIVLLSNYRDKNHFTGNIELEKTNELLRLDRNINFDKFINTNEKKTNIHFENVKQFNTSLKLDFQNKNLVILKKKNNNDITFSEESITDLLRLYKNNSGFVKESYFYPEIEFETRLVKPLGEYPEDLDIQAGSSKTYITFKKELLKEYKSPLSVSVIGKEIVANIVEEELFFKRFNREFYSLVLSSLEKNNTLRSQSNRSLIIHNVLIRVCIILNIEYTNYTILKNIRISPTREMLSYLRSRSILFSEKALNIDVIDESADIYMPTISYKGIM